jgi:hypothetical protein
VRAARSSCLPGHCDILSVCRAVCLTAPGWRCIIIDICLWRIHAETLDAQIEYKSVKIDEAQAQLARYGDGDDDDDDDDTGGGGGELWQQQRASVSEGGWPAALRGESAHTSAAQRSARPAGRPVTPPLLPAAAAAAAACSQAMCRRPCLLVLPAGPACWSCSPLALLQYWCSCTPHAVMGVLARSLTALL